MNRTIEEATVKRFHYGSHDQLRTHLADFMAAYNYARRLKTLGPHALRIHRQDLDVRTRPVHRQSDSSDAGTKHLVHRVPPLASTLTVHRTASCALFARF
jgi:hypothetical protein